jgi:GMP synthase-like glutamine amidotransferase
MKALVIKNISREGPGILRDILENRKIEYDLADLEAGDTFPDPLDYNAVFVFGGPDSANDRTEKMEDEIDKVRTIIENDIPYMGICLGMQVLVKAAGGRVLKSDVKEIGFTGPDGEYFEVEICEGKENETFLAGLKNHFNIFHLHGETVELNEDMELLARGKLCRNQIVKVGRNAYGIQGHLELNFEMLNLWLEKDPELRALDSEKIRKDFQLIEEGYRKNAENLFSNFLHIAGLI